VFPVVYITANVSGGHLNPAVTVATVCTGHISLIKAAAYIVAQVVGAIAAHLIQASLAPFQCIERLIMKPSYCFRNNASCQQLEEESLAPSSVF